MTEEEKKAMEWLDILKDCCDYKDIEYSITKNGYESLGKAINTIINLIKKQQKELEPIKKLNIPVETLVSEFNRLEDLEDNTEMLKSELEKKDAAIDKMAEMLVEDKEWFYSEFDNYSKEQFKDYFKNLVEKENK